MRQLPSCSGGTLTIVLPHMNAMARTQDMTPHPVTVYRHRADLSLCHPLIWNVTLEYTATHFNVFGSDPTGEILSRPSTHTSKRSTDSGMVVVSRKLGRKYRTHQVFYSEPVVCESITLSACPSLIRSTGDDDTSHPGKSCACPFICPKMIFISPKPHSIV